MEEINNNCKNEEINNNCKICNLEINPETKYIILEVKSTYFYCLKCLIKKEVEENEEILKHIDEIIKEEE